MRFTVNVVCYSIMFLMRSRLASRKWFPNTIIAAILILDYAEQKENFLMSSNLNSLHDCVFDAQLGKAYSHLILKPTKVLW